MLSTEREHQSLYSWSIKEFDKKEQQIGRDQIPWDWSLKFEVIELIPACRILIKSENEAETGKTEFSEYVFGKLRPSAESRRAGLYSMFGTQREINEFDLCIYQATDGNDACRLWGSVSYSS